MSLSGSGRAVDHSPGHPEGVMHWRATTDGLHRHSPGFLLLPQCPSPSPSPSQSPSPSSSYQPSLHQINGKHTVVGAAIVDSSRPNHQLPKLRNASTAATEEGFDANPIAVPSTDSFTVPGAHPIVDPNGGARVTKHAHTLGLPGNTNPSPALIDVHVPAGAGTGAMLAR